ncbi:MAG: GNAT family N-acetyltransferase [Anaerolineae bacterium]|nr:GNAT family N-acetyltransferase [Anaerolineae bacterium]
MTINETYKTVLVHPLPAENVSAAAALIAASFREEGFTRNTLNLSTPARQKRFAAVGALRLSLGQASGQQVLAATNGETLAGVAIVKPPTAKSVPWYRLAGAVMRRAPRLLGMIGDVRWRQGLRIKPAMKPPATLPTPYYTLDILGVAPDFQGQGVGRRLLEHIHAHCDQDEHATGIYLYTGDEKNTNIYRRFGYEVVEVRQGGPLTIWHMFRPRAASV